jgi:geranylgeranyl diphosphate synthase type I
MRMTLSSHQNQLLPLIEESLKAFVDGQEFGESLELKQMLAYHMGWEDGKGGGKRLRPFITLLCAGACGVDPIKALPGALSIELLHNFTLIHDDIEDNSSMRHGRQTLWKKWGIAQAINAGDALFCIAQLTILNLKHTCNPEIAVRAARELNQVCLHLTRGQYLDIAFEEQDTPGLNSYLEMINGKTAALIAFSGWLGGLASSQDQLVLAKLADFGENLGLAFQIQDDFLGVWGDPAITGKSAASDIASKKKTLPVLFGLQTDDEFKALWQEPYPTPEQVAHMAHVLENCGAQSYVQDQAKQYTDQAFQTLEDLFPQPNTYANSLFELTKKLLYRNF